MCLSVYVFDDNCIGQGWVVFGIWQCVWYDDGVGWNFIVGDFVGFMIDDFG